MEAAPEEILGFTLTAFQVLDQSNLFVQARSLDVISEMEIKVNVLGSAHCPEVKLKVTTALLSLLILWAKQSLGTSVWKSIKISQVVQQLQE